MPTDIVIRRMTEADIDPMLETFAAWHKGRSQLERYLAQQVRGERIVLLALHGERVVGYGLVVWQPHYQYFRENGIPEIVDLNVITDHQRQGIGTALIHAAEQIVAGRGLTVIGISVEQSSEYEAPNRLYPKLGYVPDGQGITLYDNELHLVKILSPQPAPAGENRRRS